MPGAVARIRPLASPALAAWLDANAEVVEQAAIGALRYTDAGKLVVAAPALRERGAAGMSFDGAVAFARSAAADLGQMPPPTREDADEAGASVATYRTLLNYAAIPADLLDATPVVVHLAAIEALRRHSHTQLDRDQWQSAYNAIRQRYETEKGAPAPEKRVRVFAPLKIAGKLDDGTRYDANESGDVALGFPAYKRGGPQVGDLLLAAGMASKVRGRFGEQVKIDPAVGRWEKRKDEDGKETWWLLVNPARVEDVAAAIEAEYPVLAGALRQNAPIWYAAAEKAGKVGKGAEAAAAAAVEAVDLSALNPEAGAVPGLRWEWSPASPLSVDLLFEKSAKALLSGANVAFSWATRNKHTGKPADRSTPSADIAWWVRVPTTQLDALARATLSLPEAHAAVLTLSPTWGGTRSALKQSREEGVTEEGSWTTLPNGTVRLYTVYKPSAVGWNRGAVGALVRMEKDSAGKWYFAFKEARATLVASALREHYPRLAEALTRSFGGVARTVDEEAAKCDPLVDMSDAATPAAVKHPIGQAVIEDVVRALKVRLPHGMVPYPYQTVGIAFAKLGGYRTLIGDAMGLGKTIQAIGCLAVDPEQLLPALVVCPAAVFYNWQAEIRKWLPSVPVYALATGATPLPPKGWKGVMVVTWNQLVQRGEALEAWGLKCIIADEAHKAKEPTTSWTKALAALAETVPHLLLLTGTPVKNRVIELWSLLRMLDPDSYGNKSEFGREYTNVETVRIGGGKTATKYEGGKNLDALQQRLRCIMVRRLKEDVLDSLPPKRRVYLPVEIPAKGRAEYERAREEFASWLEGALERKISAQYVKDGIDPATASAEIRQEVADRAERALRAEQLVKIGYLRRMVGVAKIEPALERIEEFVDAGEPVVVFADHADVVKGLQDGLTKAKIKFVTVDGSASLAAREAAKNAFQAGGVDVFIGTQAAKEGITLTRASNTIFVERWWTPGDEEQAEDRIHRIGQKNAATIWFLQATDSIDDHLRGLVDSKRVVATKAVGGSNVATSNLEDVADVIGSKGLSAFAAAVARKGGAPRASDGGALPNPRTAIPGARPIPAGRSIHALLFRRDTWSHANVEHWTRMHGFNARHLTRMGGYTRAQQKEVSKFLPGTFQTVPLTESISAIVAEPKRR